jgi:hypothetical protein
MPKQRWMWSGPARRLSWPRAQTQIFIAIQNLLTGRGRPPAIISISYLESESCVVRVAGLAGIQAIINQTSEPYQGNPDFVYYALAGLEYGFKGDSLCNSILGNQTSPNCIFHGVTLGDEDVNLFAAGRQWRHSRIVQLLLRRRDERCDVHIQLVI